MPVPAPPDDDEDSGLERRSMVGPAVIARGRRRPRFSLSMAMSIVPEDSRGEAQAGGEFEKGGGGGGGGVFRCWSSGRMGGMLLLLLLLLYSEERVCWFCCLCLCRALSRVSSIPAATGELPK